MMGENKQFENPQYDNTNRNSTNLNDDSRRYHTNGVQQTWNYEESDSPSENDWGMPPAYEFQATSSELETSAIPQDDGRIAINLLAHKKLPIRIPEEPKEYSIPNTINQQPPSLNIVIQIVGSRGDVQPFIALGTALQARGHRVRIATHDIFQKFVQDSGLEFFPIGGDPESLMAYMVKNPGIIPTFKTLTSGEISQKRKMVYTMLQGCWRSCIEPDPTTGIPFIAEAIIANPPSFAHVHCAQALGIPLHLMFTMPWSPTREFSHPLANIVRSNTDPRVANYLSYALVEMMTWQGLSGVINLWRKKSLSLDPISGAMGPLLCDTLQIPFTYCWSPEFVPKPADWSDYLDVCGFFFRKEVSYTPDETLDRFLRSGAKPIYIGFGSIVIDDPDRLTDIIISAVQTSGVRAIISRGWSKLGSNFDHAANPDILFIGDCPHEWLFKQVACVIHHGGAGTTACGLLNGCPTSIIPFFGDQAFWGQMIASAGAGPQPIHHRALNKENLIEAIRTCLTPAAHDAATSISQKMRQEDGVESAIKSFQMNLPVKDMRCDLLPDQVAVWQYSTKDKKNKGVLTIKLSDEAAFILVGRKRIDAKDLRLYQAKPISVDNLPWEPVSAGTRVLLSTLGTFTTGLTELISSPAKAFQNTEGETGLQSVATSAGKGVGKMVGVVPKAALVDLPLALTKGFQDMPKLYGEQVRDHGKVVDYKSGGVVAGKNFAYGFMDGVAGLVKKPYEGGRDGGWAGFGKGLAKGTAGLVTGPGSAMLGLFAYPFLGMYMSIVSSGLSPAQKQIMLARQVYGSHMAREREHQNTESGLLEQRSKRIVDAWDSLVSRR